MDLFGVGKAAKQQAAIAAQSAAEAKQGEADRQARIKQAQGTIDSAFSSSFSPDYFSKYEQANRSYYDPQVDNQYGRAKDKLTAQLAGQGILESGVGNQAMADLSSSYADNKASIAKSAADAVNGLKGRVNDAKTALYGMDLASADPQQLATTATATATSLAAPQSYSPLADLFAGALNTYGVYNQAQMLKAAGAGGGGGATLPEYAATYGSGGGSAPSPSAVVVR